MLPRKLGTEHQAIRPPVRSAMHRFAEIQVNGLRMRTRSASSVEKITNSLAAEGPMIRSSPASGAIMNVRL